MAFARYQLRRDNTFNWGTINPVLLDGEIGLETDTRKFKIGNGVTPWNSLPYFLSDPGTTFTQASPSATWTINHNFGYRPVVSVSTVGGVEIEAEVVHVSDNQLQILFVVPYSGSARLS